MAPLTQNRRLLFKCACWSTPNPESLVKPFKKLSGLLFVLSQLVAGFSAWVNLSESCCLQGLLSFLTKMA